MAPPSDKVKTYQRKKHFISLLHLALEWIFLAGLLATGLNVAFERIAASQTDSFYLQAAIYYGIFFVCLLGLDFLLSLYSGFYLEHAYGLSNQNFLQWLMEFLKKSLLVFALSLPLVVGLYALIRALPETWWLAAWAAFAGVSYLLGQLFPILIVPLFYKYAHVDNEVLKKRIFELVRRFKLPLENVYSLNLSKTTKKANAMFAGLGRTKRLVLSDTLIEKFSVEEIESVVAHELGHYVHHDVWLHLAFSLMTSFAGFALVFYLLGPRARDLSAFPLLYLLFSFFGTLLTPLGNAFSRWREREADRFALKESAKEGFIGAMEKLAELNLADPQPHPLVEWWFYTHPPIQKRIDMAKAFSLALLLVLNSQVTGLAADINSKETEEDRARMAVEARTRAQVLNFFYGNAKDASGLKAPVALDLYNQAVEFFNQREFDLARQAAEDSLGYDSKNPFAHELLGDIAYFEERLEEAEKHYEDSFRIRARTELKEKIIKIKKEKTIDSNLVTEKEEHFLIKYGGEQKGLEGFELKEYLRSAYREVGQDLGYFFKHKVVVLLYDEQEFRQLSGAPHWSSGIYDGKIRLPAYQAGFTKKEIQKIMRHELTHAFVAEISQARCPAWLNEGLAEYEEAKIEKPDLRVFETAVRINALFPLSSLFDRKQILEIKDPLEAQLFYVQSYRLVSYLVERYGMFHVKKMLQLFAQGKDSLEAVQEVLKISPLELEREWKANL